MTGRRGHVPGSGATESAALQSMLAAYAAGSMRPSLHALVGAHLELSPTNRAFVASLEEALGKKVVKQSPCALRAREARLDAIFACKPASVEQRTDPAILPKALLHFLGKPLDELDFHTLLPGIRECRIETGDDTRAILYKIRAGRRMPQHSHEGSEFTLVLKGGFSDQAGHFRRGDIAIADEHVDHVPMVDPGEECICFAVLDAPLRLTGPFGRWINRFLRN